MVILATVRVPAEAPRPAAGNLHLNISVKQQAPEYLAAIEPFVYEWTAMQKGSISAEHGIGAMKRDAIHYSQDGPVVDVMKSIKTILDPNGILNPYKVLPDDVQPRFSS
mmetsp:Transcript_32366/g.75981  ORF Transcript_32366/g.75981 Transcript_32366/m.75981 type:complete len:109 (+) Transcript_32366:464-790(+)